MKSSVLSVGLGILLSLGGAVASASNTRVGNGDDGKDLEGTEPITAGRIYETRQEAVQALKTLNVPAAYGLSALIPELEHSTLLMAKEDVRPLSPEGDTEVSDDRHTVYARTFAEPYAPTRFFPAALKLSRAQLIALHTHEALHRALPPNIREDEDKVALLTMAITSPSASFDRVNRIAQSTLQSPTPPQVAVPERGLAPAQATSVAQTDPGEAPTESKSHPRLTVSEDIADGFYNRGTVYQEKLAVNLVPSHPRKLMGLMLEPQLELEALALTYASFTIAGPLSAIAKVPIWLGSDLSVGPALIGRTKSLKEPGYMVPGDRQVYSIGAFVESRHDSIDYYSLMVTYTFPGSADFDLYRETLNFGSIMTARLSAGHRFEWFSLGGIFQLDQAGGYTAISEIDSSSNIPYGPKAPFQILRGGPELKLNLGHVEADLSAQWIVSSDKGALDDMGDLAGHGTGKNSIALALSYDL